MDLTVQTPENKSRMSNTIQQEKESGPSTAEKPSKSREIEIAALDTETGGIDPQKNGLISIAIVPPKGLKELKPLNVIIEFNKDLEYDHKALEINGFYPIEDRETKSFAWWQTIDGKRKCVKGHSEKEALEMTLTYLEVYLKDAFIAGCNIGFDKSFLLEACKRIDAAQELNSKSPKSFQYRLDKCLLRKTLELQTLALSAHIQNQITLPSTYKAPENKAPDPDLNSKEIKNNELKKGKKDKSETPSDIPSEGQPRAKKRRPSLSLNSIAEAVSESLGGKLGRATDQHDALEDAILTLRLTEELTKPWNIKREDITYKNKGKDGSPEEKTTKHQRDPEILSPF